MSFASGKANTGNFGVFLLVLGSRGLVGMEDGGVDVEERKTDSTVVSVVCPERGYFTEHFDIRKG